MSEEAQAALSKGDRLSALHRIFSAIVLSRVLLTRMVLGNLRLTPKLDLQWRARHRAARKQLVTADPVSAPSGTWKLMNFFFRLVLRGLGLSDFKSTMGRFLGAHPPRHPTFFEAVHHLYRTALERRDKWGLLESLEDPSVGKGDFVMHRGKRLTVSFLQSIDELYRMQSVLGFERNDPVVFCEIGAGFGRLPQVVLSAMPNARYLIFDLPECLTLSQYYLSTVHPDWKLALYPESKEIFRAPETLKDYRVAFGLPHLLRELPKDTVDVVVNIYSFMEMPPAQLEAYFSVFEDLKVGHLFIKQHKCEINVFDSAVYTPKTYPVRPHWKLLYEGTSELYEHVFEAVYRVTGRLGKG
ncbi:MAG: putative sugar O-methyltransferase [Elusimicrobia bacterium]|nr:putative sugar O-methyltransferase [Elusimicrobiota bacterium]